MAVKPVVYDDSTSKHRPLGSGERMDGLSASSIISSDSGNLIQTGSDGLAYVSGSGIADPAADNLIEASANGRLKLTAARIAEWLDGHPQDAAAVMDALHVVSSDAGNILSSGTDGGALLTGQALVDAIASLPADAREALAGAIADYLSSAGSDVGGAVVTAEGSTEPRSLSERFGDSPSAEDFGAAGDGQTDDTAAFEALEAAHSGIRVDLHGKTFKVYTPPSGNYYYNGRWKYGVDYSGAEAPAESDAYDDNLRMEYSAVHRSGAGIDGRSYCVASDVPLPDLWKTTLKDVVAFGEGTLGTAAAAHGTVSGCIAIGRGALSGGLASGYQNTGIGTFALHRIGSGDRNVAIGSLSMLFTETGRQTVCLGRDTAQTMVSGAKNTVIGYGAAGGAAPVGVSTWIERQNAVSMNRCVFVGARAGAAVSGSNYDAVVVGAYAAYSAKRAAKNTVVGASAFRSIGSGMSYDGFDVWKPDAVSADCSTDGSASVSLSFSSESDVPPAGSIVQLSAGDDESPLYEFSGSYFKVRSASGTGASLRHVEQEDGAFVEDGETFAAWTGTVSVTPQIPFTYASGGTDRIVLTVASAALNKAVVGRRVRVQFDVAGGSPITVAGAGWLRVRSASGTDITVVDDNLDSEGNTNPVVPTGTGTGRILEFELDSQVSASNAFSYNAAVGYGAGMACVSASQSTLFGYHSAGSVPTLYRAEVMGYKAGVSAGSISETVCIGSLAGVSSGASYGNSVVIGRHAEGDCVEANGSVAVGSMSGVSGGKSNMNTFVGYHAGNGLTTGDSRRNVAVGYKAMSTNPQDGLGNDIVVEDSAAIGEYAQVTGSNQVQLGASGTTVYAYGSVQDRSDARDKADVRDGSLGLAFLKALRPVDFRWDYRDDYVDTVERGDGRLETVRREKDGSRKRTRFHHGFIAQEVKAVLDAQGIDFGGYQDHKINGGADVLSLGYSEFIAPIVKAVQELDARLSALEVG